MIKPLVTIFCISNIVCMTASYDPSLRPAYFAPVLQVQQIQLLVTSQENHYDWNSLRMDIKHIASHIIAQHLIHNDSKDEVYVDVYGFDQIRRIIRQKYQHTFFTDTYNNKKQQVFGRLQAVAMPLEQATLLQNHPNILCQLQQSHNNVVRVVDYENKEWTEIRRRKQDGLIEFAKFAPVN